MLAAEGEPQEEVLSPQEPKTKSVEKSEKPQILEATSDWLIGAGPRVFDGLVTIFE